MVPFVLGIIPARAGSKGIKNKNICLVAGRPLIAYSIDTARASEMLSDVIVSTNSKHIAEIAKAEGGYVPFLRPNHLATDESPTIDTIVHAIAKYEKLKNCHIDIVVVLQPTVPLRRAEDIDKSIRLFLDTPDAKSLISCYEAKSTHPEIMYRKAECKMTPFIKKPNVIHRRQDFEAIFVRNGAIYIATRDLVLTERKLIDRTPVGYLMPRDRSVNIDEPFDMEIARFLIEKQTPI